MGKFEIGDMVTLRSGGLNMTAIEEKDGAVLFTGYAGVESGMFGASQGVALRSLRVRCLVLVNMQVAALVAK